MQYTNNKINVQQKLILIQQFYIFIIQHMTLQNHYFKKNLFLTGSTGFVGKVLLEKLLFSFPNINKIYVLIRGKKGSKLNERFKKQIIGSLCFDRLRKKYAYQFQAFIQKKIKPIQGDLLKQGLGFSSEDFTELTQNIHIIMNCAASIDFNARLDEAINSNIRGALRILDFSKKCKSLECFTHISTCYVNCNLKGTIKQEIYPKQLDPEIQLKRLLDLPLVQLVRKTDEILDAYPNTYTYTKSLCERLLKKRRQNITLCIVRPAIVNPSVKEPFEGWVDSVAAASALFLYGGIGLIKQVYGNQDKIGDMVPVDVVSDFIIVATAYNLNKHNLQVYNCGSSDRNPMTWRDTCNQINVYWNLNESQVRIGKCDNLIKYRRLKRRIPAFLYNKGANLISNKTHIKNSQKLLKNLNRADEIQKIFRFFVTNQWIFQCQKIKHLNAFLSTQEKKQFNIDMANVNMKAMILLNNYGLQKYILKQNIEPPSIENSNLLQLQSQKTYFSDLKWAFKDGGKENQLIRKGKQYKKLILSSTRVQEAIQKQLQKVNQFISKQQKLYYINKKKIQKEADDIVNQMFGQFRMPVIRFFAWALTKIFKKIYQKVNINQEVFQKLRAIEQQQIPIILAPTHRSYIDFLIVSYIFFNYKLKCPCVASDETLMRMSLVPFLLKSSGAFFIKKQKYKKSQLYRVIFKEYIQKILMDGNNLQFFIEGPRSRTGKILEPRFEILNIITQSVLEEKIRDAYIVPLTINYQKVVQSQTFPFELLGQQKVEESLIRLVKAVKLLKINYGRVYVEFCEPISIQNYVKKNTISNFNPIKNKSQRPQFVQKLGYEIIYRLTEKIVVMSTAIVSTILLMNRKGITQDLLVKNVHWLTKEILARGYRVGGINQNSPNIAVRNATNHLEDITTKTKKNIFQIQISAGQEYTKLLMLSYYRNALVHVFLPQAFIGFAINSFGSQLAFKQGVSVDRLYEQTMFLITILNNQFITQKQIRNEAQFKSVLKCMIHKKILFSISKESENIQKQSKIVIDYHNQRMINFYCSLIWPLTQSYWITIAALLSYMKNPQKNLEINYNKFLQYVQWFAQSMYNQKVIQHYESCSLQTIRNSIKTYKLMQVLTFRTYGKQERIEIIMTEQKLGELENHLRNFLKNAKSLMITDFTRRTLGNDFNFTSRL